MPLKTLYSLAAADALGAATEFKTPETIQKVYGDRFTDYQPGNVFGFAPGEATDDTQMVVATLLGYHKDKGLSGVLEGYQDWIGTHPPDVGNLTSHALSFCSLDGGIKAWIAGNYQNAGNGGLMRIAAIWIQGFRGEALAQQSALVTALTHADPRCVYASIFFNAFLEALAAQQKYKEAAQHGINVMDEINAREVLLDTELFNAETLAANQAFKNAQREARSQIRTRVRQGLNKHITSQSGYVLDTLEAALAHAQADTWLACIEPAVLLGNDSDTVACVAGAIAGARGLTVPEHLLPPLKLGHSWPKWEQQWPCVEHFPQLLTPNDHSTA